MISRRFLPFLPVISGLLLAAAWPERGFPLLLFVAFVPLLIMEEQKRTEPAVTRISIYWMVFPAFLIWNSLSTWWIYNSTLFGVVVAILLNTFFQSLMFWLFHFTRKSMKRGAHGYIALIFFWITFEFIHHHWDLNFPWMTLGNGFAAYPKWIQWYEYTGIFGGSLWVLIVNIILYKAVQKYLTNAGRKFSVKDWVLPLILVIVPIGISYGIYYTYDEKAAPIEVVAVQPNLDPYSEQYDLSAREVINRASVLALQQADSTTDFIIFPESMVQPDFSSGDMIWENNLDEHPTFEQFRQVLLEPLPSARLVVGYSTYRSYNEGEPLTSTARKFSDGAGHYDAYNTAIYIDRNRDLALYHKSKLTPGVELMPFPWLLKPFGDLAIDLGGTVGGLGVNKDQVPFIVNDTLKIAPIICYESAYGEFVNKFIRNGANAIFIITNDGWWGNTAGHRQHMLFAVIRAIETRRSIARSANTGISCFVDQRGNISQRTDYWVPASIKETINANDKLTMYVRFGDYIARGSVVGAVLLLLISIMMHFKPEIQKRNN